MFIPCFKKLSKTFVTYFNIEIEQFRYQISSESIVLKIPIVPKFFYSRFIFLKRLFHYTECHLIKMRKTCLNNTKILKASGPVSKNKVNSRWIFWVFKVCRFFDKVCQIEVVAETFYVIVFWFYIKITHGNIIFITR